MPIRDGRDPVDREILDIIPERFDSDPDSRHARRGAHTRIMLTVALALLALAALGVAARHFLGDSQPVQQQAAEIPTIKADDKPIKTRPINPGGMDVPNKDKLVYERVGSAETEPQRERLLPPPEQPQAPAAPRAPTIKPAFPAPPPKTGVVKPGEAAGEAATTAPTAPQPAQPTAPVQAAPAAQPAPTKMAAAPAPAPVRPSASSSASGGWVVQLAALKTDAEARNEWGRISSANKDVLGGLASDIVQVDLGAKGIYWRLRAGPVEEAKARAICAALAKRNQGCLVAKK